MSLQQIQFELHAPKNQTNSFGGYKYRSCEDILTALKPLLSEFEYNLIISDEIIDVGGRVYVKATCRLFDGLAEIATSCGCAREQLSKKGMDESQITGAASSYARKYALNGMFLIDDTKDADTNEQAKDLAKPRVPHDQHLADSIKSIEKAESYEKARIIGVPVYQHFKDLNQPDNAEKIQQLMANLKDKFDSEAAQ